MKTIYTFIIIGLAALSACHHAAPDSEEALLRDLDDAIARRPTYIAAKEHVLDSLKSIYAEAETPLRQFEALGRLHDEYHSYNTDSTLAVAQRRLAIAPLTGDSNNVLHARLNLADNLMFTGMYHEALNIVEPLTSADLPDYLHPYFFHIKRTIYGLLNDFSMTEQDRDKYRRLTDIYRDSILSVNAPGSFTHYLILADNLNVHDMPQAAADSLLGYIESHPTAEHDKAVAAFTLADSYHRLGDTQNEKRQLIISSISDMRSAVKEYLSLRSLALILYQEGDLEHAYKYLKLCMQDAQDCNARQRMVEINSIFPVVNDVYLDTIGRQQKRLHIILGIVGLLAVLLLVSVMMIRREMKRLSKARAKEREMNDRLVELNSELQQYNAKLIEANRSIAENSYLKEEYIARYMDQCLIYIDKVDSFRKSINKLVMAGRIDELKAMTKTDIIVDKELKSFYDRFDETFLRLFPTFIDEFNALLRPDEQIIPKGKGLNTELRIFALIRLGITDSAKIAQFLRYSLTTIYNYRTRVRNKALDRENLETELMKIGKNNRF